MLFILEGETLYGTLTGGDVRRFLLSEGKLDAPVVDAAHRQPKTARSAKQARSLLVSEGGSLRAVPVVDAEGIYAAEL